jgi:hypothetical protein
VYNIINLTIGKEKTKLWPNSSIRCVRPHGLLTKFIQNAHINKNLLASLSLRIRPHILLLGFENLAIILFRSLWESGPPYYSFKIRPLVALLHLKESGHMSSCSTLENPTTSTPTSPFRIWPHILPLHLWESDHRNSSLALRVRPNALLLYFENRATCTLLYPLRIRPRGGGHIFGHSLLFPQFDNG